MMKTSALPPQQSLLKSRRYLLFWIASLLSNIGTWMQQVAQPWIMLAVSHSSFLVGLDSFALNAPGWLLTLWGGSLADRFDRKKIILYFQGIQFVSILVLVTLLGLDFLGPWMIILISLIVGVTDALSTPAFQTIIPSMVGPKEIPQAVSLNAIQFNLARTLGPAIAGLIMVQFGALVCFGANAFSYIPFFLSIFWIYPKSKKALPRVSPAPSFESVKHTLRFVFQQPDLKNQIVTTFVTTTLCSPIITFCPVLITEVFKGQIKDFGFASTAYGLGGLIGALIAYFVASSFKDRSPGIFGISMSFIVLAIAYNRSIDVLLFLMIFAGVLLTLANNTANSNLQLKATNHVRGRYASLYQLAFRGGMSIGALATGLMTTRWGVVNALAINAILGICIHSYLIVKNVKKTVQPIES